MSSNSEVAEIRSSVKAITTEYYGTRQDVGFEMAKNVLEASTEAGREQIVVMFTDGEPSASGGESREAVEEWAVEKANEIKALESDVKIYSIATSTVDQTKTGYLNEASSNYKNGAEVKDGYYMYVTSANDLLKSFEKILNDIGGAYIELGEKSILVDTVATGFELPEDTTIEDIKVYTAPYLGADVFGGREVYTEAKVSTDSIESTDQIRVTVSGFDYSENYVAEDGRGFGQDFRGKKLIVEVPIVVSEDNIGGNYLPTNDTDSAIYNEDGTLVKAFPVPHVDVPTKVFVNKIVTGKDADAAKEFNFKVSYDELATLDNYVEDADAENIDAGSSNKVEASLNEEKTTKTIKISDKKVVNEVMEEVLAEISNVYVGSELQISETDIPVGYELVSVAVDGKEYTADANGVYTIPVVAGMVVDVTNKCEMTEVTGSKTWVDEDDKYGVRPESITINLLADGEKVDSVEVTAEDDWAWTFDNLPKYNSDKKEVVYTITEDEVKGYTTKIEGYDVTNIHVPKVAVQPDTNDHSTTGMYILMMCMAVVAMTGIVAYRRRR